jgi:hypothetical protein
VTTVPRTLLDLARTAPFSTLRGAVAEAEYLGLAQLNEIEASLKRGQPGSAALRAALRQHLPELARTRSTLEVRFLELCEVFGIPIPEVNANVCGCEVDALWRDGRLVVELDGRAAHEAPAAVARDRQRELALREAGFRVLRYSWQQVTEQPARVAADVWAALRLR